LSDSSQIASFFEENLSDIDQSLSTVIDREVPAGLYAPARYVLGSKGKRFRPHLVLAASNVFGGDRALATQVALAMEVFHIFTLVHDDIMDKSPMRRGRETIHVKWDEPTAVLAGDYLLGKSSELLLAFPDDRLRSALSRFAETVRILCEGQVQDMAFESRNDVELEEYLLMIDQKTSALLQTSLVLGAMTGDATDTDVALLDQIGHDLGRAFQIQDDLLDVVAESQEWGKPLGGDLQSGKKTYMLLKALEEERQLQGSYFQSVLEKGGVVRSELDQARHKMDEFGVIDSARSTIILHSEKAQKNIAQLPEGIGREVLASLTVKMQRRLH